MPTVCYINSVGAIHQDLNIYPESILTHVSHKMGGGGIFIEKISLRNGLHLKLYHKDETTGNVNELIKYIFPNKDIYGGVILALFDQQDKMYNLDEKQLIFEFPALNYYKYKVGCNIC